MGFSTDCIHAGQEPEPVTGAVTYPIFATSTYVQPRLGENKGYEYARTKNPTRSVLEANLAALERGKHGHCFASGMSAIDTVFRLFQSGDHVVAGENMYGGSYRLFSRVFEKFGMQFSYVDTSNVDAIRAAIRPNTKVLFLETPTNPMMTLTDLAACSKLAHSKGVLVADGFEFVLWVFVALGLAIALGFFALAVGIENLVERMRAVPGVKSVGASSAPPLGGHWGNFWEAEGNAPLGPNDKNPVVLQVVVTPGYFDAIGMTFLAGRGFKEDEADLKHILGVVVNETFAKHYWPGASAVGKRVRTQTIRPAHPESYFRNLSFFVTA